MQKDFEKWHALEKKIEDEHNSPLFREREIWWCALGANIGVEEDGKNEMFERPVLVLRKFNKEMFWGLPLTTKKKEGPFYFTFFLHNQERTAILSQLKVLSAKRLVRKIGKIGKKQFKSIQLVVIDLLAIDKKNGSLAGASSA